MKILVIEDKELHRSSAVETLTGHDITVVASFQEGIRLLKGKDAIAFEAALVDMMMPAGKSGAARGMCNSDEQVPYGFVLALTAASCGAKYVAMVTDTNHHKSAMSAALDYLGGGYYPEDGFKPNFVINGARVMFVHAPFVEDIVKDSPCTRCEKNPGVCCHCHGSGESPMYGKSCTLCEKDKGVCDKCSGTLKFDDTVHERKDWGKVLRDLTK